MSDSQIAPAILQPASQKLNAQFEAKYPALMAQVRADFERVRLELVMQGHSEIHCE